MLDERYFDFWAKTKEGSTPRRHLLIYHLLDVGACAQALWDGGLGRQTRQMFCTWLGVGEASARATLGFWAALHDLGKASPAFQGRDAESRARLHAHGLKFPPGEETHGTHGVVSAWALRDLFMADGMPKLKAIPLSQALGGHHGSWPSSEWFLRGKLGDLQKGDEAWAAARQALYDELKTLFKPEMGANCNEEAEANAGLTMLSGLVSIADWIGSMQEIFPFLDEYQAPGEYLAQTQERAAGAITHLGWANWQADGRSLNFAEMFPKTPVPNHVQQMTFEAAENISLPALALLEAPTGIGKTEAALYLADHWLQRAGGRGMYIAMPSQATSNQMFERTADFLRGRYPGETVNLRLLHGASLLQSHTEQPGGIEQDGRTEGETRAAEWFLPRKRSLLTPFGVGTVDQALLSVLQTRHFFVRLFGLGQKVVVFDEVHAYDTYMSKLFERLLGWLHQCGTSVILLSATLPEATRQKFLRAWRAKETGAGGKGVYPRLTLAAGGEAVSIPLEQPEGRTIRLEGCGQEPEEVAAYLEAKLADGGCAAVVCNRVKRAQAVYQAVKARGFLGEEEAILFHARFPFERREEIERQVLGLFGKAGARPKRAVVVATQVIEQSLDLDFDLMVSDLAPVDLLIQRAGRLQRHRSRDARRPAGLEGATLALCQTPLREGLPAFGGDAMVYEEATLLRSWLAMRGRERLRLPDETSGLIEMVYTEELPQGLDEPMRQALESAERKARAEQEKANSEAVKRLVGEVEKEDLLLMENENLEEEDPRVHAVFQALTRLGPPQITLICLDADGYAQACAKAPGQAETVALLRRGVRVSNPAVLKSFVARGQPEAWRKTAGLRNCFAVMFDANGEYLSEDGNIHLRLTDEFGLEVAPKEAK